MQMSARCLLLANIGLVPCALSRSLIPWLF
jgi:hypothetical protein